MIQGQHPHLHISALSHPGEKRKRNEDNYRILAYQQKRNSMPIVLAVLADGIGGHQAGEVASKLTVETTIEKLSGEELNDPIQQLRSAVHHVGSLVVKTSLESSEYYGMGSTVAIAWVIDNKLYTAHVGDSRIYLLRNGQIHQISTDHTWIQDAIAHEVIRPEDAHNHPRAHILQRAIGSPEPPEADLRLRLSEHESDQQSESNQGLKLVRGDQLLLCSDGLTDLVNDKEIQSALQSQHPQEAVQALVALARARGGHDNITVIILAVPEKWPHTNKNLVRKMILLTALFLLILSLIAVTTAYIIGWHPSFSWINTLFPASNPAINESTEVPDATSNKTSHPVSTKTMTPSSDMIDSATATFIATPLPTSDVDNNP